MAHKKIKVLFYSTADWANSSYRMCEAINRHSTRYEITYFANFQHDFGYYRGENIISDIIGDQQYINHDVLDHLRTAAAEADMFHFKEDEGTPAGVLDVRFDLTRPVIQQFCGSVYRKDWQKIWPECENVVNRVLVTTPDLIMPGVGGTVLPFAFDETIYKPIERDDSCIFIGHTPSNPRKKGTEIITEVCTQLHTEFPRAVLNFVSGVLSDAALRYKSLNDIYIDQISDIGTYGNSAVEAMMFGSAVLCSMSHDRCGVVSVTAESLHDILAQLITDPDYLRQQQKLAYDRFLRLHSYPAVCAAVEKIYDEVLQ